MTTTPHVMTTTISMATYEDPNLTQEVESACTCAIGHDHGAGEPVAPPRPLKTAPLHHVVWTLEGQTVTGRITCLGGRDAACHQRPDCECENWGENHEHPVTPHETCWAVDWLDATGEPLEDMYDGTETRLRSGPVAVAYDGDGLVWEYLDLEATVPDVDALDAAYAEAVATQWHDGLGTDGPVWALAQHVPNLTATVRALAGRA